MYDRNPNTGHPLGEDAISDLRTATQTVYHEQAYPSRVIVTILGRGASKASRSTSAAGGSGSGRA
jgi:hypothetical protein